MNTIDIIGTIERLTMWMLRQILFFLGTVLFGLSAPLLFTIGAEWLAWRYPDYASIWAVAYLFFCLFACVFWMILICHWHSVRQWRRSGEERPWRKCQGSYVRTLGKSLRFMILGFLGSALAEAALTYAAHRISVIPEHLMLYFAVAPFAVFAPCWIALLRFWLHWDRYEYIASPTKS